MQEEFESIVNSVGNNCVVKVVPQGMGVVFNVALDEQEEVKEEKLLYEKHAVIDIGFFYTDIIMLDRLDIIKQDTITFGISVACEKLRQAGPFSS